MQRRFIIKDFLRDYKEHGCGGKGVWFSASCFIFISLVIFGSVVASYKDSVCDCSALQNRISQNDMLRCTSLNTTNEIIGVECNDLGDTSDECLENFKIIIQNITINIRAIQCSANFHPLPYIKTHKEYSTGAIAFISLLFIGAFLLCITATSIFGCSIKDYTNYIKSLEGKELPDEPKE